jgi:hypothetical protein
MSPALSTNVLSQPNAERGGLTIAIGARHMTGPVVSEAWTVAGWRIQFVRLDPNQLLAIDPGEVTYIKVVTGELSNLQRGAFAGPRQIRSTRVDQSRIEAGDEGALFAVFTESPQALDEIQAMEDLVFEGPHPDIFTWQSFHVLFGRFTNFFEGAEAYMVPGFHLVDEDGTEIVYVHFWTAGKGVDLSTHNHGNNPSPQAPAFAEVHWVFCNGTGSGGMYQCDAPDSTVRKRYPMQRGEEHGPFFAVDDSTRMPRLKPNGAVDYPWHGWQAGTDDAGGQAYDFVAAFEINPSQAQIS